MARPFFTAWGLLLTLSLAIGSCAPGGGGNQGGAAPAKGQPARVQAENLPAERAHGEADVARDPNSVDARVELGDVYYRIAREALDREHDEERYLEFLERSDGIGRDPKLGARG